jgi:hypothetical protein
MNYRQFFAIVLLLVMATFACLVLAEPKPTPVMDTGLEGTISVSPVHGGPERVDRPNSGPLANTDFIVKKDNNPIASLKTDDQGRFRIQLSPGHYIVSRKDPAGKIGRYGPFEIDVVAGQITKVQMELRYRHAIIAITKRIGDSDHVSKHQNSA